MKDRTKLNQELGLFPPLLAPQTWRFEQQHMQKILAARMLVSSCQGILYVLSEDSRPSFTDCPTPTRVLDFLPLTCRACRGAWVKSSRLYRKAGTLGMNSLQMFRVT